MSRRREEETGAAAGQPGVETAGIEPWDWPADAPIQPVGRDGDWYVFRRVDDGSEWRLTDLDWRFQDRLGDMLEGLRPWVRAHFSRRTTFGEEVVVGPIDSVRLVYVLKAACEVAEYRNRLGVNSG